MAETLYDVIVVGAAMRRCARRCRRRENGASVLVLERAPVEEHGGNSAFTAGGMRFAYSGLDDLAKVMPDLTDGRDRQHRFRHLYAKSSSSTTWAG